MAGRAYQPERALDQRAGPLHPGLPAFGGGVAGLVNQTLHRGARRAKIVDQRLKSAAVGLTLPAVRPEPHVNGSRSHGGSKA